MLVNPTMFRNLFNAEAEAIQRGRWSRGLRPLMVYARYLVERIDPNVDPIELLLLTRRVFLAAGGDPSIRLS